MFDFFTNIFSSPAQEPQSKINFSEDAKFILDCDQIIGEETAVYGQTKEEIVEKAFGHLMTNHPDISKVYSDQTSNPEEQKSILKSSLNFLVEEIN